MALLPADLLGLFRLRGIKTLTICFVKYLLGLTTNGIYIINSVTRLSVCLFVPLLLKN